MTPGTAATAERQFLLYTTGVGRRASGAEASFTVATPDAEHPTPDLSSPLRLLRDSLAGTAAARVTSAAELLRRLERTQRSGRIPTTLAPFDELLGGGLPRGKMIELTGRRGAGRFSIALSAIASATSMGEAAALIDLGDHLDPGIAEADGVDLRRLLWVRPATLKQAVMSAEMIAAAGFQLVVVDAGLHPIRGRRVPDAAWVRLGRAAEAHGAVLLVSTPYALTGTASEAVVKTTCARMTWAGRGRAPRLLTGVDVELLLEKHRHRKAGGRARLALRTEESMQSSGLGRSASGAVSKAPPAPDARHPTPDVASLAL
jgi:hypothetical protein